MLARHHTGHPSDRVAHLLISPRVHDRAVEDVNRRRDVDRPQRQAARGGRLPSEAEVPDRASDHGDVFLHRQREGQPDVDRVARTGRDLDPGAHCLEAVALDHERVAPRSDAGKREAPIGTGHRRVRGAFEPDTGVGYRLAGFLRDDASDDLGGRLRECGGAPQV